MADKSFLPLKLLYPESVVISGSGLVCVFECVQQDAPDVPKRLLGLAHLGLLACSQFHRLEGMLRYIL